MPTTEEHRQQKARAIAEVVKHLADVTAKLMPKAFPRKRPRICVRLHPRARMNARKRRTAFVKAMAELYIRWHMSRVQIALIISQPIPKHPPGTFRSAVLNEQGKEIVILQNNETKTLNSASNTAGESK